MKKDLMTNIPLSAIAETVVKVFPDSDSSFEREAQKWISSKQTIVSYKADKAEGSVRIILQSDDPMSSTISPKYVYTMLRLFPLETRWSTSIDVRDAHAVEIFDFLLEAQYEEE